MSTHAWAGCSAVIELILPSHTTDMAGSAGHLATQEDGEDLSSSRARARIQPPPPSPLAKGPSKYRACGS
eukprot:scaffold160560_cov31-Tisochrysis_lutea.AAC.2